MFINAIFEVGLISEGFSIIRKQFMNPDDLSINPLLVGEILSSIQGLIHSDISKIPKVLEIEQFIILLNTFTCGKEGTLFIIYAICQASSGDLHETLSTLATELKLFNNLLLNWNVDTESLRNLYPIFEEAFLPYNK